MNTAPRSASVAAVAVTDARAYVAALFLAFIVVATLLMYGYDRVTGWQSREPWDEVAAGVALIAFSLLAYARHRTNVINNLLTSGTRVAATLENHAAASPWVIVRVRYVWQGRDVRRTVFLGDSKRSRRLKTRSDVTLAVDTHRPRRVAVVDLYDPGKSV